MSYDELECKMRQIVAEVLETDARTLSSDADFVSDLKTDSLDILQILVNIEEEFSIKIQSNALSKIQTIRQLTAAVNRELEQQAAR